MNLWKAQARTAAAAGSIEVRRQGESANRKISIGRHMSAAVAGDWILVAEDAGVCWGLELLGTGPTAYPTNPAIDGAPPTSGTLTAPPAWTARFTHGGVGISSATAWVFGRDRRSLFSYNPITFESSWTTYYDQLVDAISVYQGLAGLTISSITLQLVAPSVTSATAKLVLYQAPANMPASAAAITQLATVDAPMLPTAADGATVTLPAAWRDQIAAGTANGVGILDAAAHAGEYFVSPSSIPAPALSVQYA